MDEVDTITSGGLILEFLKSSLNLKGGSSLGDLNKKLIEKGYLTKINRNFYLTGKMSEDFTKFLTTRKIESPVIRRILSQDISRFASITVYNDLASMGASFQKAKASPDLNVLSARVKDYFDRQKAIAVFILSGLK